MVAINANPVTQLCQRCSGSISDRESYLRVKKCGHLFHAPCLLNDGADHIKVGKSCTQIFCPQKKCNQLIAKSSQKKFQENLYKKLEVIPASQGVLSPKKTQETLIQNDLIPKKNIKTLKAVTYIAVAMSVMLLSVALFPSIIGLGVGFLSSIPLGYLAGRVLDKVIIGN